MIGDVKGYVITNKILEHSHSPEADMLPDIDERLANEMNDALITKMLPVIDIAYDGSSYIVLAKTVSGYQFLWMLEKDDVLQFIEGDIIKNIRQEQQFDIMVDTLGIKDVEAFKNFLKNNEFGKMLKVVMDETC